MQKKAKKVKVVIFDFDGTLSAHDANYEFGKYCFRHSLRPWLFLPITAFGMSFRYVAPNAKWWRQIGRRFINAKMVKRLSPGFIAQHKLNRFGWAAERVAAERAAGNVVILISASPNYLLRPLVADMDFDDVICSEMYADKPWKYHFLCYNKNKVVAFNKWAKKNKIAPRVVRAYSDSKSDLPIMELAAEQVWIDRKTGGRISK
ncbi:MAG: HAD-IB family phosphatase [Alphaproteobacteria bacterium]|nr:HAD-IB family phosphatase [Alphaproteobacteria bacterium]